MAVYLRVKRPKTEDPVSKFESEILIKKPRLITSTSDSFCYIGTQTNASCSVDSKLDQLCSTRPKTCKLLWNKKEAFVVNDKTEPTEYQIHINTLKRPATATIFDQSNDNDFDFCKTGTGPKLPKIFKIIEITPNLLDDTMAKSINDLKVDSDSLKSDKYSQDLDFVYDIYRLDSNMTKSLSKLDKDDHDNMMNILNNSIDTNEIYEFNPNYDPENDNYDHYIDDEDDSNSESNWRNDYPDDLSSSSHSISSSTSKSNYGSDEEDEDEQNIY